MPTIVLPLPHDLRVLSPAETAKTLGLSEPVLERLRAAGEGPPWVRLSARRVGYRVADLAAWLESRRVSTCPDGAIRGAA